MRIQHILWKQYSYPHPDRGHVDVRNCVIANSSNTAIYCSGGGTASLGCNDLLLNTRDYFGCFPGAGDFYENPLFCDPILEEFPLEECSPWVQGNGCGLVGAFDVGCECTTMGTETILSARPSA